MKYDSQLNELKNLLPTAKKIFIALPTSASIDQLASGLALFLVLKAAGKEVSVASETEIKVGQAHLFGVDHVQKTPPLTEGGNLTLTLEGVAASDNTIPALEKLDWAAEGNNLNLVFHVLPGQTFQPARIVPHYQGSGFNLIFVIGATNLNALGSVYSQSLQVFSGTHVVNIDTQSANTSFGQTNVIDAQASCISEVMANLMSDLGLSLDADCASNLLAGIFDATVNLSDNRVTADTFMAVANCLRVGGRKPFGPAQSSTPGLQPAAPAYDWSALMPKGQSVPEVQSIDNSGDDSQPSPEELPVDEAVTSETVEPEWLTPKIFKGSSLG